MWYQQHGAWCVFIFDSRNVHCAPLQNTPVSKQMQLRNSNLRELPVAPGNMSVNSAQPISSPTPSVRPVARATQGARPGQNIQPAPNHGRGRGQVPANTESQPGAAGRAVVHKEVPSTASAKTQEVKRQSDDKGVYFISRWPTCPTCDRDQLCF